MSISGAKSLRRNICKILGHEEVYVKGVSGSRGSRKWYGNKCTRCKKTVVIGYIMELNTYEISTKPQVKYKDITVRRFKMFDRTDKPQEP